MLEGEFADGCKGCDDITQPDCENCDCKRKLRALKGLSKAMKEIIDDNQQEAKQ